MNDTKLNARTYLDVLVELAESPPGSPYSQRLVSFRCDLEVCEVICLNGACARGDYRSGDLA